MKIEVTTLSTITAGDKIAQPDDDTLDTAGVEAAGYDADDQDWQLVRRTRGHADVGEVLCEAYDGSSSWVRVTWEGLVWVLCNDDGSRYDGSEDGPC